jgi:thioredoxin-dependent peroxiredoxin
MAKTLNVFVIALLLVASVGGIWYLSGVNPSTGKATGGSITTGSIAQGTSSTTSAAVAPSNSLATDAEESASEEVAMVTPDLSKVDAYEFLDLLPVGRTAPPIQQQDASGQPFQLKDYAGKKNVVLVFYQGHFCSVCAHQLQGIQNQYADFKNLNTEVVAISADDATLAQKTQGENGLSFKVLPDSTKRLIEAYGVRNIGRDNIAWPSAYIVDKKGTVRLAFADKSGKRMQASELLTELIKIERALF